MVAVLLRWRRLVHLDLRLLHLLLRLSPPHHWFYEHYALLCLQLLGLPGVRPAYWHNRLLDRLYLCKKDLWCHQSGLKKPRQIASTGMDITGQSTPGSDMQIRKHSDSEAKVVHMVEAADAAPSMPCYARRSRRPRTPASSICFYYCNRLSACIMGLRIRLGGTWRFRRNIDLIQPASSIMLRLSI